MADWYRREERGIGVQLEAAVAGEPGAGDEPAARRPRGRLRRWGRRLGIAFLLFLIALTAAAAGFDAATGGRSRPATELYAGPFVRVGDTLVAYRRWGTEGTPILLLGGAAEPSWVWHRVGPLLARKHRVYALDLPPFGYTQRHGPYSMSAWLGLVRGFEQKVGIARPLVVGHSLGAGVAAAAALDRPQNVSGIVLLDGDALPIGHRAGWLPKLFVYPFYPALYRLLTGSDWFVGQILRNAWGPSPPHFGQAILDVFERPFRVSGTAGALKEFAASGAPGVTSADLARVKVPRAVVWGAHDSVDSLGAGRAAAATLHVPIQLIPRAGHLSMLANPTAVAAAIVREAVRSRR